jgi:hypothetical protein
LGVRLKNACPFLLGMRKDGQMKCITCLSLILLVASTTLSYADGDIYDDKGRKIGSYRDRDRMQQKQNELDAEMLRQGYVPKGAASKKTTKESLDELADSLGEIAEAHRQRKAQELEQKQKAISLYNDMVDAGYSPMQAWEFCLKSHGFPPPSND